MTNLRGLLSWACAGLIAGGIALSPAPLLAENLCRADEVIVTSPDAAEADVVRFSVEIADDAEERALGLMSGLLDGEHADSA